MSDKTLKISVTVVAAINTIIASLVFGGVDSINKGNLLGVTILTLAGVSFVTLVTYFFMSAVVKVRNQKPTK